MGSPGERKYILQGLDCAACAAKIEAAVAKETGLQGVGVDFATRSLYLPPEHAATVQRIIDRIEPGVRLVEASTDGASERLAAGTSQGAAGHGHKAERPKAHDTASHAAHGHAVPGHEEGVQWRRLAEIGSAALLLVVGSVFHDALHATPGASVEYLVFLAAYWLVGRGVVMAAARNARRGQLFDENSLMTIATAGAMLLHELPEAVGVMLFYAVGEAVQDAAVRRSRRSVSALLDVRPDVAYVRRGGQLHRVAPAEVQVGEEVIVRPGEKIPLDGEVVEGDAWVDTSALTGEPAPRQAVPGTEVLAGMVNTDGVLTVRVTKPYAESSAAKILALVERAAARKAPTEKFITTFSRYYTPAVVGAAALIALVPPLVVPGATFSEWLYRALVLLVISCPCALVLSIPVGYFGGIGGASRRGILVKGANFLDALTQVHTVAFDKTGTLTRGVFRVGQVTPVAGASAQAVLEYAAHAEHFSRHPIAASIRDAYGRATDAARIGRVQEVAGYGVIAEVDGRRVLAGNDRLLHREGVPHGVCTVDGTVVNVAVDGTLVGRVHVGDELKPDAADAIRSLKRHGVVRTVMLTGDEAATARQVADIVGIDEVHAGLLPEQKVEVLERLMQEASAAGGKVAFAGDGVNDAPVLTRADIGIAMGALGSDAAIEAADVVIMDDQPSRIPEAIAIARRTRRIVYQNIVFSLAVKAAFIALGAVGVATMWEAVFADVGVSLIAVLNATRALRT
ncbi:MAG: cadmium-translocating P-type ATPase [Firmicutes bacterium ZCTH02-B6]|nr:MAG: cadmium-translocating P-type ATPase [Firmicutes bacterium ZCTH02-B6]